MTAAFAQHRVLIVDDEEIVLVALRETLRRSGHNVSIASTPEQALEELKTGEFAVLMTDHNMPAMTGLQLIARAKQLQPQITCILITAVLNLDTVINAINEGEIYRFIVKPWLREELLAAVKSAVIRYDLVCRNRKLQEETQIANERLVKLNHELEQQVARVAEEHAEVTRLNSALEENLQRSLALCLRCLETFYPMLGGQARRALQLCRSIAAGLKLSPEDTQALETSALLHDIGLIGVPRNLIRRSQSESDTLTDAEWAVLKHHSVSGEELASFVYNLEKVGPIIRAHHERFDGAGYPDGLAGENIPWLARLLAVVAGYVETDLSEHDAIEAVKLGSGSAFDPDAVRAFLRALPKANMPLREREVLLSELQPGMVLARDIYTANSLLLVPEGQQLSATSIDKILNHNRIAPITQSLVVYC